MHDTCAQNKRSFNLTWSPRPNPSTQAVLMPVWHLKYTFTLQYEPVVKHMCSAVPVHDPVLTGIALARQIQLICSYDYIRDNALRTGTSTVINTQSAFGSYLVRVAGDGQRLDVHMQRHVLPQASSSLFYDVSFNTLYASSYTATSYSGQKRVYRIKLSVSYNFVSENSSTATMYTLPNAALTTSYAMPGVVPNSAYPSYPAGMNFDNAFIEPFSNKLFFYVPTRLRSDLTLNMLYYIEPTSGASINVGGNRAPQQPVLVESSSSSVYVRQSLASISSVYSVQYAPKLIFTLLSALYVQMVDASSSRPMFYQLGRCSACPVGKTSARGAVSLGDCYCEPGTYWSYAASRCQPARTECKPAEFISVQATHFSDIECMPCPACRIGYYRDQSDCVNTLWRDPMKPVFCRQCTGCGSPGYYIDPQKCDPTQTTDTKPSDCKPCNNCGLMETIVGTLCPGNTVYNTQSCQKCIATCPAGTYIADDVTRCNGQTWGPGDVPFNPATECVPCGSCPLDLQAQVGGCTGRLKNDGPQCVACQVRVFLI